MANLNWHFKGCIAAAKAKAAGQCRLERFMAG